MTKIDLMAVKQARYIKLGVGGCWESLCFKDGTLRLGYNEVPHELGLQQDFVGIRDFQILRGMRKNEASDAARQVVEFYATGPETLWFTVSGQHLWWAVSDHKVDFLGHDPVRFPNGSRLKRTLNGGWSDATLSGKKLEISRLSGKLIKSASYPKTICKIGGDAFQYLLLKLTDQDLPLVRSARENKAAILSDIVDLIKLLSWRDFELFVSLLFDGWRRVSIIGGEQKSIDITYENYMTCETAVVQVKSVTDQKMLNDYCERLDKSQSHHIFYAYHTSKGKIRSPTGNGNFHLLGPNELAEKALKSGLLDWLIDKAG